MEVLQVKIKVLLLFTILCCVDSQFMPPQMGGMPMQFPQMPQMQGMSMNPGQMQMPAMPGMGMPMQVPLLPQPKMPVVVMPYNKKNRDRRKSRNKNRKRRKHRSKKYYDLVSSYSDESSGSSQETEEMVDASMRSGRRGARRNSQGKRRQVLTPVISYVTKDGYVVYQKKIKKEKAKDWLNIGKSSNNQKAESGEQMSSSEEILRKVLKRGIQKIKNKKIK